MNNIDVTTESEKIKGKKIRYINFEGSNYFIYSLNEKDEEEYEKLYVNKIIDGEEYIISDFEWEKLKSVIPTIVKQIRSNNPEIFKDLDITSVNEINLDYSRIFKLKSSIVVSIEKKETNKLNLMDKEIQNLLNEEKQISAEDKSLDKLDEFLKNPIIDDDYIQVPEKPYILDSNNIEELKKENSLLVDKVNKLEEKIKKIKDILE